MQRPRYHPSPGHLGILGALFVLSGNSLAMAAPLPKATGDKGSTMALLRNLDLIASTDEQTQAGPISSEAAAAKSHPFLANLPHARLGFLSPPPLVSEGLLQAEELQAAELQAEELQAEELPPDWLSTILDLDQSDESVQLDNNAQAPFSPTVELSMPKTSIAQLADGRLTAQSTAQSTDWAFQTPEADPNSQLTSVHQLSDVQSTDWAFQALQLLVERYGVLVGYPDGTYQGDRALSRYEFAAGVRAALDRVGELTAAGDPVSRQDLEVLERLQEDFALELAQLSGRVDVLEAQTAELEANQFSTTTTLFGQLIFALTGISGEVADGSEEDLDASLAFSNRLRVAFLTSFTGEDLLVTLLQSGTNPFYASNTATPQTTLSFPQDTENDLVLNRVEYTFPIGDRGTGYISPTGSNFEYFVPIFNDVLNSSGTGTLSVFGFYNPNYLLSGDSGGGITYDISDSVGLSLGYLAGGASDPAIGVTGGTYGALAQLRLSPTEDIDFGLTYIRSFNALNLGVVGTRNSNQPFGDGIDASANSYGFQTNVQISPKFGLGGWLGLTQARATEGPDKGADADILNWAVTMIFPDLFAEGNLGAIIVGEQPRVIDNDLGAFEDSDTSLHIEALYRYQINDNIGITPGFILTTNPNGNSDNDSIFLGVVRTTFQF